MKNFSAKRRSQLTNRVWVAAVLSTALLLPFNNAQAVTMSPQSQKAGVTASSLAIGAVAGGPVGAVVGLLAGVWLGDKVEDAHVARETLATVEEDLAENQRLLAVTQQQLLAVERENQRYAQAIFDQLQFELSFRTGEAVLPENSVQRLDFLARFMVNNPSIQVRMDGYADPRGGEAFNQRLSEDRVQWVADQLVMRGVAEDRIQSYSHGEEYSSSKSGDIDGFALERVVKIELSDKNDQSSFAQQ